MNETSIQDGEMNVRNLVHVRNLIEWLFDVLSKTVH